jgi:hypothetical protein
LQPLVRDFGFFLISDAGDPLSALAATLTTALRLRLLNNGEEPVTASVPVSATLQ